MTRYAAHCALFAALLLATPTHADAPAKEAPAMWRIADGDSHIYLFGTFHLLPKGTEWTTPAYHAAMKDAATTVTECDIDSAYARRSIAGLVMERGLNASWETLRGVIGGERYNKLVALANVYGVSTTRLQSMRPWLASLTLSVAAIKSMGFDPSAGVERTVLADAKAEGDKVRHLETAEAQIKALMSIDSGGDMLVNFDLMLSQLADMKQSSVAMLADWRKGDLAALERDSGMTDTRKEAPAAYRAILVNRNANWTEQIQEWLNGKGNYFIAVGAAHLSGPDSVIAMLAKRGIKAERIQ